MVQGREVEKNRDSEVREAEKENVRKRERNRKKEINNLGRIPARPISPET